MSLGLVARSSRALSEHINTIYRTLKGVDPESVALRLPAGGTFEVRNSASGTPVLQVSDAGIQTAINGAVLSPGSVTSTQIADGTIVGADIANATITPNKLTGGSGVPADAITTVELADNAVQTANILANAVTQSAYVYGNALVQEGSTGNWFDVTGMSVSLTTTGGTVMIWAVLNVINTVALQQLLLSANVDNGVEQDVFETITHASVNTRISFPYLLRLTGIAPGPHTFKMRWRSSGGVVGAYGRSMLVTEHKR